MSMETITLYVVRSRDGQYFHSKGYGGYGSSWFDSIKRAKVYTNIGAAKSQVTYWAKHYPDYGVPVVVPLTATEGEPINQEERVGKVLVKQDLKNLNSKLRSFQTRYDMAVRNWEHKKTKGNARKVDQMKARIDIVDEEIFNLKNFGKISQI